MSDYGPKFWSRFQDFKERTLEEHVIAALVKGAIDIQKDTTVLDVGGGSGKIAQLLQPHKENITIVDIRECNHGLNFVHGKWETASITKQYDIVLMSHVYGKFYRANTLPQAYAKGMQAVTDKGHLVLCYNKKQGTTAKILYEIMQLNPSGLIDYFDEALLPETAKEIPFTVQIKETTYDRLVDHLHVLYEMPDADFKNIREAAKAIMSKYLNKPVIDIPQKVVVIPKQTPAT